MDCYTTIVLTEHTKKSASLPENCKHHIHVFMCVCTRVCVYTCIYTCIKAIVPIIIINILLSYYFPKTINTKSSIIPMVIIAILGASYRYSYITLQLPRKRKCHCYLIHYLHSDHSHLLQKLARQTTFIAIHVQPSVIRWVCNSYVFLLICIHVALTGYI